MAIPQNQGRDDLARVELLERVSSLLTANEEVLCTARQIWLASPVTQDAGIVTTRRFIIFKPKLFGRMAVQDLLWQDVEDVHLSVQMLSATVGLRGRRKKADGSFEPIAAELRGLDKQQAMTLYARAQEIEEQWREKNRIRQMEEERAKAGGVYVHPTATETGVTETRPEDIEKRLIKLKDLREKGLITDAEYESRKAQIIADL